MGVQMRWFLICVGAIIEIGTGEWSIRLRFTGKLRAGMLGSAKRGWSNYAVILQICLTRMRHGKT
jgi:hypothetical protein